ncbi:Na-translocating system protein MpsC family protein [Fictibacillus sp. S7]|uniref:Na-translocating system protein MpsC family protein n=1 Tax=Fictibacillus sp. S7 TaxID=2212476 RepID=UPI0010103BE2|nr:Na-translocating system protein MpsC family protein [Fictibacillus sp. S7]RXZ01408.1 hypothetical protein DMO16_18135 [Fictibacillus sp. S7]
MEVKAQQSKLANNLGKLLRDNFGKGPEAIHVTIYEPYVVVYVSGFVSPMEQILLNQNEEIRVMTTRELLMKSLEPEITGQIKGVTDIEIQHLYYDWNLEHQSGIFVGVCLDDLQADLTEGEPYEGKQELHDRIIKMSKLAQKEPERITSYKLSPRTLVVVREGILVAIERQLISMGFDDTLRICKRPLEKGLMLQNDDYDEVLNAEILDIFVDWDFEKDNSIITLILKPKS